jgi:Protein of unknown function (DUF1588)/Protein of unknown function (DUF1592)/Protein of unknown function (DUF1595)/Protein of unknown function (DUF1587)
VNPKAATLVIGTLLLCGCGVAPDETNQWQPTPGTGPADPGADPSSNPVIPGQPAPVVPGASTPVTPGAPVTPGSPGVAPPVGTEPGTVTNPPAGPELIARTWRLTHEQYQRAIADLFAVDIDLGNFAPETGNGNFVNFSSTAFVRQDLATNYFNIAKDVAAQLTGTQLATLTSCNVEASCSAAFISELARKVFRRPAPADLAVRYRAIIDTAASSAEPGAIEAGFRAVIAAMLNSPLFLYRTEMGAEADEAKNNFELTDHELASELSFSLLGRIPPEWLSALADTGALRERAAIGDAVQRLLSDPAANTELARFLTEWLEVHDFDHATKSEDVFPGFDTAKPQMQAELTAFLAARGQQDNTLADLLIGAIPEVSSALTDYYFSDPSAPADTTATSRAGVLGLGIVLSDHAKSYLTSPTLRGTFVRKRFFCQEITLPANFTPPPLSDTEVLKSARTTRELYEQHQADPTCAPCHDLTDNIGFVLEEFDGAGRVRTLDTTQGAAEPLNLAAELTSSDVNRPLSSLSDLNAALSESAQVRQCLAQQAFRFYFGQGETSTNLPPIAAGSAAVEGSTLGALLSGLFTTESTHLRVREPAL